MADSDSTKARESAPQASPFRLSIGRDVLGLAFLLVISTFAIAVVYYPTAADVTTVVGPVTTLVGTLIGTIFGVQATSQSRDVQANAQRASSNLAVASALLPAGSSSADIVAVLSAANSSVNGNPPESAF